jgi:hypothetical protein
MSHTHISALALDYINVWNSNLFVKKLILESMNVIVTTSIKNICRKLVISCSITSALRKTN